MVTFLMSSSTKAQPLIGIFYDIIKYTAHLKKNDYERDLFKVILVAVMLIPLYLNKWDAQPRG
ncbi:hypothetical protein FHS10_004407 [Mucilaginibacter dorajii]|uniref:Uncharacterized protein n=1 Tax=Mucilaginibacter dorajii TaxID=692994 RepID=A0ABP7PY89_9SPHI|nr:hypothetical protein [Mucilaginibacter dorajii]